MNPQEQTGRSALSRAAAQRRKRDKRLAWTLVLIAVNLVGIGALITLLDAPAGAGFSLLGLITMAAAAAWLWVRIQPEQAGSAKDTTQDAATLTPAPAATRVQAGIATPSPDTGASPPATAATGKLDTQEGADATAQIQRNGTP